MRLIWCVGQMLVAPRHLSQVNLKAVHYCLISHTLANIFWPITHTFSYTTWKTDNVSRNSCENSQTTAARMKLCYGREKALLYFLRLWNCRFHGDALRVTLNIIARFDIAGQIWGNKNNHQWFSNPIPRRHWLKPPVLLLWNSNKARYPQHFPTQKIYSTGIAMMSVETFSMFLFAFSVLHDAAAVVDKLDITLHQCHPRHIGMRVQPKDLATG